MLVVQTSGEAVLLQAGVGLSVYTERELVNHRKLLHPNIIRSACMLACFQLNHSNSSSSSSHLLDLPQCRPCQLLAQPVPAACCAMYAEKLLMGLVLYAARHVSCWLRFKEVFYDETYLAIVMEYASQGHLSSMLERQCKLSETDARRYIIDQHAS